MGMEMSGNAVMNSGMTPSEAILVADRNRDNDNDMFGGGFMWVFFLFFLLAWGGNGFGGWGNGNGAAMQGALTRGELCQDMNFQSLENGVRGIQQGLCDGFYAMNTTNLQGFHGVDNAICNLGYQTAQLANGINSNITEARFDAKSCCCETNRNIDAVRYENARNTCDIVTAIKEDGAATRALITQNTIQDLRDKLEDRDREILARDNQLSQQAQSAYLVDQLRPCARPAYITCSPYQSALYPFSGYNGYGSNGCGCGCGSC